MFMIHGTTNHRACRNSYEYNIRVCTKKVMQQDERTGDDDGLNVL